MLGAPSVGQVGVRSPIGTSSSMATAPLGLGIGRGRTWTVFGNASVHRASGLSSVRSGSVVDSTRLDGSRPGVGIESEGETASRPQALKRGTDSSKSGRMRALRVKMGSFIRLRTATATRRHGQDEKNAVLQRVTATGSVKTVREPSPSLPAADQPQQNTPPSSVRAHA